jgi:hypothetical protein
MTTRKPGLFGLIASLFGRIFRKKKKAPNSIYPLR